MRELKQTVYNVIMWVLVYFAIVKNVAGAYNLMVFFIWILFFSSIAITTDTGKEMLVKAKSSRSKLSKLFNYTDLVLAGVLVWYDHWFLGVIVILSMVLIGSSWDKIEDAIKKGSDDE